MAKYATTAQHENQLVMGSAKVEVSANGGSSWTNLGIARSVSVKENITKGKTEGDNAPAIKRRVAQHTAEISFTMLEFYQPTIAALRGGSLDTQTSVAGTPVEGASQVVASGNWSYNEFIELTNQNGAGTCPTINSVTGGTDGALTEETDYITAEDGSGKWGIIIWDSTNLTTESQTITINTDYTPAASQTLSTGGLVDIDDIDLRFTNTETISGTDYTKTLWVYEAYVETGLEMAFKSCNEEDPAMEIPMTFTAELDTTRTAGDQLMIWTDTAPTS